MPTAARNDPKTPNEIIAHPKPKSPETAHSKQSHSSSEEWKYKPPYRVHDLPDDFPVKYKASCHCGKVKYSLSREKPLAAKFCHCTTCQTIHGAPFQWAAIFQKEDIDFSDGVHGLEWYESSEKSIEHKLPCKVRCGFCGTWIMDEGRNMILLFPTLIHFESKQQRDLFAPTCHMFYTQRVVDIKDGKDKWSGMDKSSELLDEADVHGEVNGGGAGTKRKRDSDGKFVTGESKTSQS